MVDLRWAAMDPAGLAGFEVRRGEAWHGGLVVAQVGPYSSAAKLGAVPAGEQTYHVRARFEGGLYSSGSAIIEVDVPPPGAVLDSQTDIDPTVLGTAGDGVESADGAITHEGVSLSGVYTGLALDLGAADLAYWSVQAEIEVSEDTTWDDLPDTTWGGDGRWRTWLLREPSTRQRGADFDWTWGQPLTWSDDVAWHGPLGGLGEHAVARIESRYQIDDAEVWSEWTPHRNQTLEARKIQVRAVLLRRHTRYRVRLVRINTVAVEA